MTFRFCSYVVCFVFILGLVAETLNSHTLQFFVYFFVILVVVLTSVPLPSTLLSSFKFKVKIMMTLNASPQSITCSSATDCSFECIFLAVSSSLIVQESTETAYVLQPTKQWLTISLICRQCEFSAHVVIPLVGVITLHSTLERVGSANCHRALAKSSCSLVTEYQTIYQSLPRSRTTNAHQLTEHYRLSHKAVVALCSLYLPLVMYFCNDVSGVIRSPDQ